jgi:hypothetical protein
MTLMSRASLAVRRVAEHPVLDVHTAVDAEPSELVVVHAVLVDLRDLGRLQPARVVHLGERPPRLAGALELLASRLKRERRQVGPQGARWPMYSCGNTATKG